MSVTRLALITIVVDDYDRAIAHFVGDLGFELTEDTELPDGKRWVVVSSPDRRGTAVLLAVAADSDQHAAVGRQAGGRVAFFLHTADLDADRRRMESAGVRFVEPTRHERYGSVAVFEDRYGNRWDLLQPAHLEGIGREGRRWLAEPGSDVIDRGGVLAFSSAPATDWFRDVRTGATSSNAPVAVVAAGGPVTVSCSVSASLRSTFDAAGLLVHHDDEHWVKFALERSPTGRATIVSVRTEGWSDDVNHLEIDGGECRMRVTVDDRSVALHLHDPIGDRWQLVRYAAAPSPISPVVGLLVQSPTGEGTAGEFRDLAITAGAVTELRDGT